MNPTDDCEMKKAKQEYDKLLHRSSGEYRLYDHSPDKTALSIRSAIVQTGSVSESFKRNV